ncbi:MAG: hypothetical protein H7Y03_04380 [Chitinophagaceae bacterium]|nr:hypothetical protein [Chitinophagaceae bacterium]
MINVASAQLPGKPVKATSNLRKKNIPARGGIISLDSLSIIPGTLQVTGIPTTAYSVDYINALLTWHEQLPLDSVQIIYRVFNSRINEVTRRFNYDSISNNFLAGPDAFKDPNRKEDDRFFDFGNLTYNGSFGRGISFGNAQDAVVTSNLNLQLSGFLADSIEIMAAITDNNIPIQPDGTTQQLNEFDRIYLQFRKKGWQLSMGDIDIRQNGSYFLNFYKRLQGVAFENTTKVNARSSNKTIVSGSIAKGKFTRNIFDGQEGNQGPYRLTGANNEFYFTVLAGTERVFINGELLQRGEDQDYIINYNTAELTFTPARMITKDSRIQVEFEYADRNYLNTNLYISNELNINDKFKWRLSAFNNSDSKGSPINQSLDVPQKQFLNLVGDSISKAFYPIAMLDTFNASSIMYKQVDTVYNGGISRDQIYLYSTDPDSAQYSLSFIEVGLGNGDYIPDFNGANGKVYRWIEPVNGSKQGNYLPATFLVTPKKQQVISTAFDYAISKNTLITTEFGYSNYNINTFSLKDKKDDKGYAARVILKNTSDLSILSRKLTLSSIGSYEYVDPRFKPLERLRNVEFLRDWGLTYSPLPLPATEHLVDVGTQLSGAKNNSLRYQFSTYLRDNDFRGFRNTISHVQEIKSWRFNNHLQITNSTDSVSAGYFLRPTLEVSKRLPALYNYVVGSSYSLEHNESTNKKTDTVSFNSFSFETISFYVRSPEKSLNKWGLTYFTRTNKYPFEQKLLLTDRSQNINLVTELLKNERHQFRLNVTYRNLHVVRKTASSQNKEESLLGRAEYQVNEWKGLITGNALYEVGSGQEQKRDFTFLEVPAGQGEYTWLDYNSDGVQQLNEFEIALFQDQAKYIRIFTPSNQFVRANFNTFNYALSLNPRVLIDATKSKGFRKIITNTNLQSSLQILKKEIAKGLTQFNPFSVALNDTSLISLTSTFINTLSYNRFSTQWGVDLTNSKNSSKSLLTYGYESRDLEEWALKGRINFSRAILIDVTLKKGSNTLNTSNAKFDNRNYDIDLFSAEPRISFTRGTNFRFIAGYKITDKKNKVSDRETYYSGAINSEIKYNILQNSSILGKFTYSNITFKSGSQGSTANPVSTVSYIMLDGLLPGKNYLWNLDLSKRLSNNLEITIQYEGRKPGTSRIVNIGRASIRALL